MSNDPQEIPQRSGNGIGNGVTAKDIGKALGLSQPTVSRILSGSTGHRISEKTRARVLEAATRMGYRPNAVARSLRQRRTHIVGFYTGYGSLDARNAFLATIIGSLQQAADKHRLDLLLHGIFRGDSTEDTYSELMNGRIDGLFIHTHAGDPLAARLAVYDALPVVAIADHLPGIPSLVCDDESGTRALVDYLWERGHRRIGYVHPTTHFASVERRVQAFQIAMQERGASQDAPCFAIAFEDTAPVLAEIRTMANPPTAVCCWNDLAAFDLIRRCEQAGLRVPGALAIVGFDGLLDPKLTMRPLVTVGAHWSEIAEQAMEQMVRLIDARLTGNTAEDTEIVPAVTMLPVHLIAGDTA